MSLSMHVRYSWTRTLWNGLRTVHNVRAVVLRGELCPRKERELGDAGNFVDLRNGFSGLKTARFGLRSLSHWFQDPQCDSRTHSGTSNWIAAQSILEQL